MIAPALTDPASRRTPATDDITIILRGLAIGLGIHRFRRCAVLLEAADRKQRLSDLQRLWACGCQAAIDEGLFADAVYRNPTLVAQLRPTVRRGLLSMAA